jgi:hypothetical protein
MTFSFFTVNAHIDIYFITRIAFLDVVHYKTLNTRLDALQHRRPPLWARPLRHQLVSSTTRWSSLLRSPTTRSASTPTTTASHCGIVRWRTFSVTSWCRDWSLTIWRHSCILCATTPSLGLSRRPRDMRHGVPRCSRRWM